MVVSKDGYYIKGEVLVGKGDRAGLEGRKRPDSGETCLRSILERVSEIIIVVEGDGTVCYASPSAERSLGRRVEDLCGSSVLDYLHREDVERVSEDIVSVLGRPGGEVPVRMRLRNSGGSWRAVAGSLSNASDDPNVGGLVLAVREAPDRTEASGYVAGDAPYEALIRYSKDLVTLCNEDNTIRYVSPSVRRILGYEPEELVGVYVPTLIHPDDLEYAAEQATQITERSTARPVPVRYRHKDGSWIYLESVTNNLLANPDVAGVLINSRDVTNRVRAEEEIQRLSRNLDAQVPQQTAGLIAAVAQMEDHEPLLRERAESLRNIFEHAAVGIVQLGTDGEWLMANRRFCEMTAFTREELFRGAFRDIVHPEDRDNDLEERERLVKGEVGTYTVEKRCIREDGNLVWIEMTASLVRDPMGDAKFCVLVAEDITERKRSEAALRQSEEHYRAVVEQANEGIFLVDAEDKRILEANAAFRRILGYSDGEILGKTLYDFVVGDDTKPSIEQYVGRVLAEGGCRIGQKQYRRKDGSVVDVEVDARTIRYNGRDVLCCVARDITGRKEAEEALRLSEERFRYLVQYASDVITIVGLDGTVLYESPSVQRVLGYNSEDLVGANVFTYVHPDDLDRAASVFDECLGGARGVSVPIELRLRHADGSWRLLEVIGSNLVDRPSVGGIVINARDVTERKQAEASLKRNLDMLLALHEANRTLSSTLEMEEIASRLLEITRRVSDLAAAGVRMLDGERWGRAERIVGSEELLDRAMEAPETISARESVLLNERPVSFRFAPQDPEGESMVGLCLPLRTRDKVLGVLEAYGPESLAEDDTIEILVSLARQAASALENARLYEQLGEREQRLQDLVSKLLTTQEEERRRVAYEVHDGLAQVAVAAHQHLQVFARRHHWGRPQSQEDLGRILKLVRSTVTESRRIIANLRPTVLDDLGLASAIALEVENLRDSGFRVDFEEKLGEERLPPPVEITLYRVTQEALTNMRKHAQTDRVRVRLWRQDNWAYTEVRDWGRGFDTENSFVGEGPGERIGLSGMQERVVLQDGDFDVRSQPGEGTSVVVGLPL